MLKVTGYVMKFAPIAVFAAVAGTIAKSGLGVLSTYGVFMVRRKCVRQLVMMMVKLM